MIRYNRPDISVLDAVAVWKALTSSTITQGPKAVEFEGALSKHVGSNYAVVSNSATSSILTAYQALGIGKESRVWTAPNTFVATANAAKFLGAEVDFVDINYADGNMSVDMLTEKLEAASQNNALPHLVVPVHFGGKPCNMKEIWELSQHYGFRVVEDASHALGASYKGRKVGACEYSDVTVSSFHAIKMITTGEGGVAFTNQSDIYEKLRRLRSHGITSETHWMSKTPEDEVWNYQQLELGLNLRMTDFQAALGTAQLAKLDSFIAKRARLAGVYLESLPPLLQAITDSDLSLSSHHLFVVRYEEFGKDRTQRSLLSFLRSNGIEANLHYTPVHLHPFYQKLGFKPGDFPAAERHHKKSISLPIHTRMSNKDVKKVLRHVSAWLRQFSKG